MADSTASESAQFGNKKINKFAGLYNSLLCGVFVKVVNPYLGHKVGPFGNFTSSCRAQYAPSTPLYQPTN